MRLRHYDNLRNFVITAKHTSLTAAAEELCLTKGALSHQLRVLEDELGFALFDRHPRGIGLSEKGRELLAVTRLAFDEIERKAVQLGNRRDAALTIGTTTYFASRWLSPRLMDFIRHHPDIRLRIQPMIEIFDLQKQDIDLAIRWGDGRWDDGHIEKLFGCPAWPTGNRQARQKVERLGPNAAFRELRLLSDRADSNAWSAWFEKAGIAFPDRSESLIIPDPNVRVQAVLDGQGIALNDQLVDREIKDGSMFRLSPVELEEYGYFLAIPDHGTRTAAVSTFVEWIRSAV